MEPKSVTLKYNITAADYLDAARLNGRKKRRWTFFIFTPLFVISSIWWALAGSDDPMPVCVSVWTGVMLAYFLFCYLWWVPRRVEKLYRQQKMLHQEITAQITEQAFKTSIAEGESEIPWETYYMWAEDSRTIILKHSQVMFQMLPKRCFATEDDINWLRGILTAKIKK